MRLNASKGPFFSFTPQTTRSRPQRQCRADSPVKRAYIRVLLTSNTKLNPAVSSSGRSIDKSAEKEKIKKRNSSSETPSDLLNTILKRTFRTKISFGTSFYHERSLHETGLLCCGIGGA